MDEEKKGRKEDLEMMAEQIPKVLKAVSDTLPEMITKIMKAVYSEEVGQEYGKSVAAFYRTLKESGMPEADVRSLTQDFIINQQQFMGSAIRQARGANSHNFTIHSSGSGEHGRPE